MQDVKLRALIRWFAFFLIGALISFVYRIVDIGTSGLGNIRLSVAHSYFANNQYILSWLYNTLIMCGYLAVGFFFAMVEPVAIGSGIPEVMGFLNGSTTKRAMDFMTLIVKVVGVICAVASGLAVGPEGPMIHIGALVGVRCIRDIAAVRWLWSRSSEAEQVRGLDRDAKPDPGSLPKEDSEASQAVHDAVATSDDKTPRASLTGAPRKPGTANGAGAAAAHRPRARRKHQNRGRRIISFRNDHDERVFTAVGAAAGITAAFRAPIGGVLFAVEEAISFFNSKLIFRTYMTTTVTYIVLQLISQGNFLDTITFAAFGSDMSDCNLSVFAVDIFFYMCIGVLGGLLGALFNAINMRVNRFRRDHIRPHLWLRTVELILLAVITSSVFALAPVNYPCTSANELLAQVPDNIRYNRTQRDALSDICVSRLVLNFYENGAVDHPVAPGDAAAAAFLSSVGLVQGSCPAGYYNELLSLTMTSGHNGVTLLFRQGVYYMLSARSVGIYLVAYFFLSCISSGVSLPSGLVVPMLLTGGAMGRLFALVINAIIKIPNNQQLVDPGGWAIIGAAAFWCGCGRLTVTIAVIVFEVTGDVRWLPPLALAVMMAKWTGDMINPSLYHSGIYLRGLHYIEDVPPKFMDKLLTEHIMTKDVVAFEQVERPAVIEAALDETQHNGFPIVRGGTGHDSRKLTGLILRTELLRVLYGSAATGGPSAPGNSLSGTSSPPTYRALHGASSIAGGDSIVEGGAAQTAALASPTTAGLVPAPALTGSSSQISLRRGSGTLISRRQLSLERLREAGESPNPEAVEGPDTETVDMCPYMHATPYVVTPQHTASQAYMLFRAMGLRHLCVVDHDYNLVGILTRIDLVEAGHGDDHIEQHVLDAAHGAGATVNAHDTDTDDTNSIGSDTEPPTDPSDRPSAPAPRPLKNVIHGPSSSRASLTTPLLEYDGAGEP